VKKFLVLLRLVLMPNLQHRFRTVVTLLGIGVAVSLAIWNLRNSTILQAQLDETARQQGRYDAVVSPKNFGDMRIDPTLVDAIRGDEGVREVDVAVRTRARQIRPEVPAARGPFGGTSAVGTGAKEPPQPMIDGVWLSGAAGEAVISRPFQERMEKQKHPLKIGDEMVIGGNGGEVSLKIIGLVPGAPAPTPGVRMMPPMHLGDVFISLDSAEKLNGNRHPGLLCVALKDPEDAQRFSAAWQDRLAETRPEAAVRLLKADNNDPMAAPPGAMQQLMLANATILAMLAALFIIFATLSTNVRERLRQFAILRALALSRSQLLTMVVIESFLFALAGWVIGLGLMKGFLFAGGYLSGWSAFFRSSAFSPAPIEASVILISLGASVLGALAAAALPAWQACRIDPVDILGGQDAQRRRGFPKVVTVIGLALIAVNPLLIVLGQSHEGIREALTHFYGWGSRGFGAPIAGSLAMIVGLILVTPAAILVIEKLFSRTVAWMLRLDPRFLRQQLSGNLWRAVGTTMALSIGLTLFVTSVVWGYSMLVPFTPTEGLPRMILAVMPAGVPADAVDEVGRTDGLVPGQCIPIALEQPRLTKAMLASAPFAHVDPQQQHLLFMGVDPNRTFGGDRPLFHLDFVEGSPADAAERLAEGPNCVVPDHFATQTGLGLGDSFSVEAPNTPGREVRYTIVGIASVPGWNWLTKFSETRRRAGRALAMVFVDYEQARRDFAIDRINYFWANSDLKAKSAGGVQSAWEWLMIQIGAKERPAFGAAPAGAPKTPADILQDRLTPLANRYANVVVDLPQSGQTMVRSQYVKATDREDILTSLFNRADDTIWALLWLPLITLCISSLAVFNTVAASVRSRYWQFGVLRGVGLTGGQLLRLILAESLLLCGAACVLSLVAGVALAWCSTRLCTLFFFFGGHTPPLTLPWGTLALGFGLTVGLCLLAGVIPAIQAAVREPLKYIQEGRLAA
jgi:putative ABC transport system permease protein